MPYKTPELPVSPSLLKWARETGGYSPEDIANRLGVSEALIEVWERGAEEVPLRVTQLEDLARFLKRPLATFLLVEPPPEPTPPRDFRHVVGPTGPLSPSLRLVIRRATRLQRVARELMESMGIPITSEIPTVGLRDKPELVGKELRRALGIGTQEQLEWSTPGMALRNWRQTLEALNILVFQGDFNREEAQGFSISDEQPCAIVLTFEDHPYARCFTLFHELGHLLLREGGICVPEQMRPVRETRISRTEDWCHRFAEAFLIDEDILLSKKETGSVIRMDAGYESDLRELASQFKVSRAVILFRLWHGGTIPDSSFWLMYSKLPQWRKPKAERNKKRKGGPPPAQTALQERGRLLSRLILEAVDRNILGYTDAADYLGVRPKHFEKIRLAAYD